MVSLMTCQVLLAVLLLCLGAVDGRLRGWWSSSGDLALASFFRQRDHHKSLLGRWQRVPLFWSVFEHDLVFLIVYDHSMASLIVDAEQRAGIISTSIEQMHADRLSLQ